MGLRELNRWIIVGLDYLWVKRYYTRINQNYLTQMELTWINRINIRVNSWVKVDYICKDY